MNVRSISLVPGKGVANLHTRMLRLVFRCYRAALSPMVGSVCRFEPSCSHYAEQAIARWGIAKGVWLAARRLGRCHPFSRGGVDLVPEHR